MSTYLGDSEGWLQILEREGVLAVIDNNLTLWQHKMLFNNPIIRNSRYNRASDFLTDVSRKMRISWVDFCNLLDWRMRDSVLSRVRGNTAGGFEAMLGKLTDCIGLTTDYASWVAASGVSGAYSTLRENRDSIKIWIQDMKNQHPERLRLVGAVLLRNEPETTKILSIIREYGCADMFGLESQTVQILDHMDVVVAEHDWKQTLRNKLNPVFSSALRTVESKDNHIESVLEDKAINNYIRRVAWLLPDDATLLSLLNHTTGAAWADLVAVLVEIAERATGAVDTTFPMTNVRESLRTAIQRCQSTIPFTELIFYSPTLLPSDRDAQWQIEASTLVKNQQELVEWANMPKEMVGRQLSSKQMIDYFKAITTNLNTNQSLRAEVLSIIKQRRPTWQFAYFETMESALFDVKPKEELKLDFVPPSKWPGGKKFLSNIGINNDKLAAALDRCEGRGYFSNPKIDWPTQLTTMGAVGIENLDVESALIECGLIK
jgi:hypothetical protein